VGLCRWNWPPPRRRILPIRFLEMELLDQRPRLRSDIHTTAFLPGRAQPQDQDHGRRQSDRLVRQRLHAGTYIDASPRTRLWWRDLRLELFSGHLPDRLWILLLPAFHLQREATSEIPAYAS
jgi:hypothetical protein